MITPTDSERTTAMLSHILAIVPGLAIIAPLVIYLLKKNESAYVAYHSKESLNFQITILILYVIGALLVLVLIGFVVLWIIPIFNAIFVIIATIRANDNELYRYPFSLRLI